ncbi:MULTISPECIES: glycosyl hydrolase [unclassified Caballeronia]|uniref:glycosyl hydrolase n=1 Tax=unclassified Caballeronia TaxID=2646786 RepID=UPI001F249F9C|nr:MULTISPECIES: glycosyl hydrolase [unclassified Caballeronia]MCE4543207.1 glycoside hydrolase family protein [Caballeronia sp. PC1]MCE4567738.1 glycoside hydrolase family protein [Caballeronia sp. CLC5]
MNSAPKVALIGGVFAALIFLAACGGGKDAPNATTNVEASAPGNAVSASEATAASSTKTTETPTNDATAASSPVAASSAPASSDKTSTSPGIFYGANGHNNGGGAYDISSPALQLAQLQNLGVKLYRNEVYNRASVNKLAGIAKMMAAGGVTVFPVLLVGTDFDSESDAYDAGYALGRQTAQSYRYPYYEVANELGSSNGALLGNVDGVYPEHYDNAIFQKARGAIRGLIAGIKSVDTSGKIILGGETWLHYSFDQMLAAGTQPDGSGGHPVVMWDITAWHWYSEQGDITNACGGTGCHNVLRVLQRFGKPIWLTEVGVRPWHGSDQQIASYMVGNRMMAQFVSLASQYDVQAIQVYQLYDDPSDGEGSYGLVKNDGKTEKAAYTAFKNFVAANPK